MGFWLRYFLRKVLKMIEDRLSYCFTLSEKIEEVIGDILLAKFDSESDGYRYPPKAQFKRLRVELTKELKKLDDDLNDFQEWNKFVESRTK